MNNQLKRMSVVLALLMTSQFSNAADEGSISTQVEGPSKKAGVYAALGNPYPTLLGLNAAYNVTPHIRASLGYGEIEVTSSISISDAGVTAEKISAKTYGAGAEYLFMSSSVHPVAGLHVGYLDISGKGTIDVNGFKKSGSHLYSNMGIDWIASSGYQVGAGLNVALLGGAGSGFYLNSGWFF